MQYANESETKVETETTKDNTRSKPLDYQPPEWSELYLTTYLSDGTRISLLPNGEDTPVNLGNKSWENLNLNLRVQLKKKN